MLISAMLLGFVFWVDVPTAGMILGSASEVASGLFLLGHETGRRRVWCARQTAARKHRRL
jgi:hypothetical protein